MVATGLTALEMHEDGVVARCLGDGEHRVDLLHGAGLERVEVHAERGELVEQCDRLVLVRNARADGHAADRRPGLARLLNQLATAAVQVPQVAVQVQGVEDDLGTRLQRLLQFFDAQIPGSVGHLPTTGDFGGEPGVGGGRDDRHVDGGRRHARQDDRRLASGACVTVVDHDAAVGEGGAAGRVIGVANGLGATPEVLAPQPVASRRLGERECTSAGPSQADGEQARNAHTRTEIDGDVRVVGRELGHHGRPLHGAAKLHAHEAVDEVRCVVEAFARVGADDVDGEVGCVDAEAGFARPREHRVHARRHERAVK